jgi:hypothetical protein
LDIGDNNIITELQRRSYSTETKNKAKDGASATNDLDKSQKLLMKKRAEMFETLQTLSKTKSSTSKMEFSSIPASRGTGDAALRCDRSEAGGSSTSEGASSVGKTSSKGAKSTTNSEVDALLQSFKKPVKVKIDYAKILADKLEVLNISNE